MTINICVCSDAGTAVSEFQVPHTITEWVGNAVCLSSDKGVGVAKAASFTAFQPFFVSMSLPYSVIRGEELPVAVTVSNYLTDCLPVSKRHSQADVQCDSSSLSACCRFASCSSSRRSLL